MADEKGQYRFKKRQLSQTIQDLLFSTKIAWTRANARNTNQFQHGHQFEALKIQYPIRKKASKAGLVEKVIASTEPRKLLHYSCLILHQMIPLK